MTAAFSTAPVAEETRRPLLQKRGHAFPGIIRRDDANEGRFFDRQSSSMAAFMPR